MNDVIRVYRERLGSNVNKYGGFWKYTAVFAYMQAVFAIIVFIICIIPWLTRFLLFQQGRLITYFPHYPCIRFVF
jgi:hypothetical protein